MSENEKKLREQFEKEDLKAGNEAKDREFNEKQRLKQKDKYPSKKQKNKRNKKEGKKTARIYKFLSNHPVLKKPIPRPFINSASLSIKNNR